MFSKTKICSTLFCWSCFILFLISLFSITFYGRLLNKESYINLLFFIFVSVPFFIPLAQIIAFFELPGIIRSKIGPRLGNFLSIVALGSFCCLLVYHPNTILTNILRLITLFSIPVLSIYSWLLTTVFPPKPLTLAAISTFWLDMTLIVCIVQFFLIIILDS